MSASPKRVKEPVQVYLEAADKALLDQLSEQTSLPRAELLRRGLRVLAAELSADRVPGRSMSALIGSLDSKSPFEVPTDLSSRHDEYLYPAPATDGNATGGN
jgi:hypothetical protein